jgi:RND family efflux transporter MFP subunit
MLFACGKSDGQGGPGANAGAGMPPPPSVGVASPVERSLPVERELIGAVETIESVQLMPRVGGLVVQVPVHDGAEVKAGDTILQIDRVPFQVALDQANAAVQSAQASQVDAQQNLKRSQPLLAQHAISQQQIDDLTAAEHVAAANLANAKAGVEAARLNLDWTRVIAPISGRIGKILTTTGNLVVAGGVFPGTVITSLVSQDPVYVGFDLDEQTWRLVGGHLRASGDGGATVSIKLQLAGESGYPHQGAIAFADNQVDSQSGSIRVRGRFTNVDRALTPGAFARVLLEVSEPRPVILINECALISQLSTRLVWVVDEHGIPAMRPVTIGEHHGSLVEIVSGLSTSDEVIVNGIEKVFMIPPNTPIQKQPVTMEDPVGKGASAGPGGPGGPGGPSGTQASHDGAGAADGKASKP